MKVYVYVHN